MTRGYDKLQKERVLPGIKYCIPRAAFGHSQPFTASLLVESGDFQDFQADAPVAGVHTSSGLNINYLEILAVSLLLRWSLTGHHILVRTDNAMTMTYINH